MSRFPTAGYLASSAGTAPTRRITLLRSGKIPTTSVRRRISRLSRFCGLLLQICRQISFGELAAEGVQDPVVLLVHCGGVGPVVDAVTNPACALEVTSIVPVSPRATRPRKNASQPAPSSLEVTSR